MVASVVVLIAILFATGIVAGVASSRESRRHLPYPRTHPPEYRSTSVTRTSYENARRRHDDWAPVETPHIVAHADTYPHHDTASSHHSDSGSSSSDSGGCSSDGGGGGGDGGGGCGGGGD